MHYDPQMYFQGNPLDTSSCKNISKLYPETQLSRVRFAKRFIRPHHTVADICCGSAFASQLMEYKAYLGVDHPEVISLIKKDSKYNDSKTAFIPFDFEDQKTDLDLGQKVDRILSFETIEHLNDPDRFLRHLNKNLKPEGLLILSTPNNHYGNVPRYQDHIKEYSLAEIRKLLDESGFQILDEFVMGVPFGLIRQLLKGTGIKTHRHNYSEDRGRLSKLLDHLPLARSLYCSVFPSRITGIDIYQTGENMIVVASKR